LSAEKPVIVGFTLGAVVVEDVVDVVVVVTARIWKYEPEFP